MSQYVVEARSRTAQGKNVNRRLRVAGRIPGVMYGPGKTPVAVSVDPHVISDILHSSSGHNTIFALSIDGGEQVNAMVKDYQLDPVKGKLIHADFFALSMDRKLELSVDIEIVGEAKGVKNAGGIMDVVTRSVDVECLPADIPESIQVDVSQLEIDDYIRVKNLPVNPGVQILSDPEVVIVMILPPVKEEVAGEEAPAEEAKAEPEVIRKGKAAEEEEED